MKTTQRINLSWGGGADSVVFSVRENRFWTYEKDCADLHARYGGQCYYTSHSGLSGAGYLEVEPNHNDLIMFGWYRTDARNEQWGAMVHSVSGNPVSGYVPITSHGGIDWGHPIILTDGVKVAFAGADDVKELLLMWSEVEGREYSVTYFDQHGNSHGKKILLHNPDHFGGVRVTRFLELHAAQEMTKDLPLPYDAPLFQRKLGIVTDGVRWFHLHSDGFLDQCWNDDPRDIKGHIVAGWIGEGDGLFWKRGRERVQAFMELKRQEFESGKYVVQGETEEWIEFEEDFSIFEWFSKTTGEWKQYFLEKIHTKARQDYIHARQRTGIDTRKLMEAHPQVRIRIQDSLDCGNCLSGTHNFISKYGIETDSEGCVTVQELLESEHINEMLQNFAFTKVIQHRLVPEETPAEPAESDFLLDDPTE